MKETNPEFKHKFKYHLNPNFFSSYYFKLSLACLIIFLITIQIANATTVTTNAASAIGVDTVTFNANVAGMGGTGTLWFEYGNKAFKFKSANQTISNGVSSTVIGEFPIMANTNYQYRAIVDDGVSLTTGNTVSFITPAITPIDTTDYNFTSHFQELVDAGLDPQKDSQVAVKPYTDPLGNIFWGILFGGIFMFIWLKQEDVTIPSILGILIGAALWNFMSVEWVAMAQSLLIVSIAGIIYSLIRPRT